MLRSCNRILCKLIGKNRPRKQEEQVSESTLEQSDSFSDDSCDADSDDEFDNDNVDGEEDGYDNGDHGVDITNVKTDNDVNYDLEKVVDKDDGKDDGEEGDADDDDDDKRYSDVCNIMEYKTVEKSKTEPDFHSPSPEQEGETYEVPDAPPQLPPPIVRKLPPALPSTSDTDSDEDGEVYDELEGIAEDKPQPKPQFKPKPPPSQDIQGEIYDECDIKEQDATTGGEIYEDPEVDQLDNEGGGEIYEVPDETTAPKSNIPSRRDTPVPPPPPSQRRVPPPPSTTSMPGSVPSRSTGQTATKSETNRKMSGEGAPGMGISLTALDQGRARLRKVGSGLETEKEPEKGSLPDNAVDMTSVKDKISLFKAVETGPRPSMTVKPSVHSVTLSSRNLPPPPPPPVYSSGLSPGPLPVANMPHPSRLQPNTTTKSPVNQVPSATPQPKVAPVKQVQPSPPPSFTEEIYDDAINILPVDPLSNEAWYHGERDRKECEKDLTAKGKDGSYMVRKSTQGGDTQPYTLVVLYKGHVYNLRIRRRPDNKIALGNEKEAEQELAFDSVPELIEHHTTNEVILINKSEKTQYKAVLTDALQMR